MNSIPVSDEYLNNVFNISSDSYDTSKHTHIISEFTNIYYEYDTLYAIIEDVV